jgi:beta-mannosidase
VRSQSLIGAWQFRRTDTVEWLPANVPGGVHSDLLALGRIPDPFDSDNETAVMWVAEADWEYRRIFVPSIEVHDEERILLVADGLDTIAEVRLNGELLGRANNQFRLWEWEIGHLLQDGENELAVLFAGPTAVVTREQRRRPMNGSRDGLEGAPHVRKAPCQFGWDWGPRLPSIGIWRDIRLEGRSIARLQDVQLRQTHSPDGAVAVHAKVRVEAWGDGEVDAVLAVTSPDASPAHRAEAKIVEGIAELEVRIEDPALWWPNGHGEQPLYRVDVELVSEGRRVDERVLEIGLRTIELRQEDDA